MIHKKHSGTEYVCPYKRLLFPILLMVFGFVLYWNTLGHGFVHDDITLILQNPAVQELRWSSIFTVYGYRPIRTLTYALNFLVGGSDPAGYHLFNVLLHAFNSILVYWLFLRATGRNLLSISAALVFIAHPVQTAAVAYVSGRKDLLAAFFILMACQAFLSFRARGRGLSLFLCLICFFLGVLSKEVTIVLPFLLLLLDLCLPVGQDRSDKIGLREHVVKSLTWLKSFYASGLILALAGLYYVLYLIPASRMEGLWGGSIATHFGTSFKLFLHYLRLILVSHPLIADYTGEVFKLSYGFADPSTLLSAVLFFAFVVVAVWVYPRRPLVSLGMGWVLVTLLPVLQIFPFHELAADHFLYIPSVGAALLGGVTVEYASRERGVQELTLGILLMVLIVFSIRTIQRNKDWENVETLWHATYEQAPGSYRANSNLAVSYQEQGNSDLAMIHTRKALKIDSSRPLVWNNLGALYFQLATRARVKGDVKQAEKLARECRSALLEGLQRDAADPSILANMGNCYRELAYVAEASSRSEEVVLLRQKSLHYYQRALEFQSRSPKIRMVWLPIGGLFMDHGLYGQAIDYLMNFVDAFPENPQGQFVMGLCHFHEKEYREAIPYLEQASRHQPNLEKLSLLAKSYEELGELNKAIQVNERAVQLVSSSVEAHYNLGVLYTRQGETNLAINHLEKALELSPLGNLTPKVTELLVRIKENVR